MIAPAYQELKADEIPTASTPDGSVRVKVVAGESLGQRAAIGTHTPILYLHFTLQPGATHTQDVPHTWNAFAYHIDTHEFTIFAKDGDTVELTNPGDKPVELLLIAGEPLGEAVARYGPFVMNTKEELYQAFEDYRAGKMGTIPERK